MRNRILWLSILALFGSGLLLARSAQTNGAKTPADESRSAVSAIDQKCQRMRGPIQVPQGKTAWRFRIQQLAAGVGCETGAPIDYRRFAIQNSATEETVYSYDQPRGRTAAEKPVRLAELILPPGDYLLSVAGGSGAVCSIAYDLAAKIEIPAVAKSIRAAIDRDCIPRCAAFAVTASRAAQGFRLRQLDSGTDCHTGQRILDQSFSIENTVTGQIVYRYAAEGGRNPVEKPVKLNTLRLDPGLYRLCLAGGRNAVCILEYDLVAKPGAVPKPIEIGKKPPKPVRKPAADPLAKEQHNMANAIDLLVLELDGLEESVDELKDLLDQLKDMDTVKRYLGEITRLQGEIASVARRREELKDKAKALGLDFAALAGDQLGELESRPRNLRGDLSLLEDQALAQERRLENQKTQAEDGASSKADIDTWLDYAKAYAQRTGVALDLAKIRTDMEAKASQKAPARAVFYADLFGKYIDCLVAGAQKRTTCRVSGRVISLKVEPEKQRVTYEYEIVRECPEKTYKDPGRGGTSFEELERWVRDACKTR